jgi:hypothetical protein
MIKSTPVTPTLSDAVAVTVTIPLTVEPLEGAVSETTGLVVSGTATTLIVATDDVAVLPAASYPLAATVWLPRALVAFQV